MARVSASTNGSIYQFFPGAVVPPAFANDPGAVLIVDFDESTNAALIADLQAHLAQYSIASVAGVATLEKNGTPVAIAAGNALFSLQSTILAGVPDATIRTIIVALWNGTATAVQQQKALAYALLKLKQTGMI
jgi:hypothetical protein